MKVSWAFALGLVLSANALDSNASLIQKDIAMMQTDNDVSPVQKVVTMMEDLQTQVILEGKAEAKTYDKFACFCKDMSEEKTWDIEDAQDLINELTATINELSADREAQDTVITEQTEIIEARDKTMKAEAAKRAKSHAEFQAELDDCYLATKEIDFAVAELKAREGAVHGASLISLKGMTKTVRKMALMADAMGLTPKSSKAMTALLQQDPEVPMEDFAFDATEVIKTVKELKPGFEGKAKELKVAELKTNGEHTLLMQRLTDEKKAGEKLLADANKIKAEDMQKIAESQQQLTATTAQMTDDQAYLKELTEVCNARSKDWDQRSKMRQDELTALTSALSIVKSRVSAKTTEKTVRLAQQHTEVESVAAPAEKQVSQVAQAAKPNVDVNDLDDGIIDSADDDDDSAPAFLQLGSPRVESRAVISALQKGSKQSLRAKVVASDPRNRVLNLLRTRSEELESPVLAALAARVAADPFVKIRKLIQELIERLLQEAADEANHKGFCDKAFGKAKQARATKVEAITALNTALSENEAKRDKLTEEIAVLTKQIDELDTSLSSSTKQRNDESAENAATISEAEEGKAAVEEAIDILDKFYKTAAKAEMFTQEIPGMPDAGFEGSYKASQGASTGIIGMMDVIKSDFERTISVTTKEEKKAADDFLKFDTETKSSLAQKRMAKTNNAETLVETQGSLAEDKQSLTEEQALLDQAIQEILELQPACVDTGMSYEERVAKREQEIESLKEALCTLDKEGPEQTEPECA